MCEWFPKFDWMATGMMLEKKSESPAAAAEAAAAPSPGGEGDALKEKPKEPSQTASGKTCTTTEWRLTKHSPT